MVPPNAYQPLDIVIAVVLRFLFAEEGSESVVEIDQAVGRGAHFVFGHGGSLQNMAKTKGEPVRRSCTAFQSSMGSLRMPDTFRCRIRQESVLKVWDAQLAQELNTWPLKGCGRKVAFSPDRKRLASASDTEKIVKVWNTETGEELLSFPGGNGRYDGWPLVFSPDGKRLLKGSGGETKVWDVALGAGIVHTQGRLVKHRLQPGRQTPGCRSPRLGWNQASLHLSRSESLGCSNRPRAG